jgi:hypothetical protein
MESQRVPLGSFETHSTTRGNGIEASRKPAQAPFFRIKTMELWSAFFLGLVGSLHCAGMCGPLALALPISKGGRFTFVMGRTAYNLGRLLTYTLLGIAFGLLGKSFAVIGAQRWISIAAGVAILLALFASPRRSFTAPLFQLVARLKAALGNLLERRSISSLAVVGTLNGLLPCGLVYVACAGAATTGGLLAGAEYMFLFGLGTVPVMLAASLLVRIRFQRLVPVCLFAVGTLLILRGLSLGIPFVSPDLAGGTSPCH